MVWAKLTDQCLWLAHIEATPLRELLQSLPAAAEIDLSVDGDPITFKRMATGSDGRETNGLVPIGADATIWRNRYVAGEHQDIWLELPEDQHG